VLARQVSTRPERIHAFFEKVTREQFGESFIAVLEVCGFNDWLIRLLNVYLLANPRRAEPRGRKLERTIVERCGEDADAAARSRGWR